MNNRICTHCGGEFPKAHLRDELTIDGKVSVFCSDCFDLDYSDCMIQFLVDNPTIPVTNLRWRIEPIPGIDIVGTCHICDETIEIDDKDYLRGEYLPSEEMIYIHTDCYDILWENWKRDYKMEDEGRIPEKSALCITVLELDI